ncbi:MAG: hypothetical protein ACPGLV_03660 [Bacteroidia bacterium]
MLKYSFYLVLISISVLTFSCKSEQEKQAEELKKQVEDLHDDLMMKTEDLVKLRTKLGKELNQTNNLIKRGKIKVSITLINSTESFMEDWMSFYGKNKPKAEDSLDDSIKFYEKQLKELGRMEKEMNEALENGREFIKKMTE